VSDVTARHTLRLGDVEVEVRPDRGALITRLNAAGIDVLYLDAATVESPTGAVRGGIPLLFPFAGELENGHLQSTNTTMPRHGFGRRKPWTVTNSAPETIAMRLVPDSETRAEFPFEFEATQTVAATQRGVSIELAIANRSRQPLPLAPGWHPYFPCPADRKRACLQQLLPPDAISSIEPTAVDVNVPAPVNRRVTFALPAIGSVTLSCSDNLKTLEIWTPPDRDLVCVEPWVGPSNTINTASRVAVPAGATERFWMAIELEP
jgi:galactose mutarotase-like enzyme